MRALNWKRVYGSSIVRAFKRKRAGDTRAY